MTASEPPSHHSAVDAATFTELQDATGADFVYELIGTFLEEAPSMLTDLRTARAALDADAFRRAAHSLKSNSLTFGALQLADLARQLELHGFPAEPAVVWAQLDQEFAAVRLALQSLQEPGRV
jgi:histidine phosphotransfer protein HptB